MIKKGTRLSLFLTAVLGFLSISVGHAAFQTGENGATDSFDGQVTLRKPVCYISGSPNVYYASIEKALNVAENTTGSQTVYVIPGANPTIQSNCKIASGDSLILPYADDGTNHSIELFNSYDAACSSSVFGDSNPSAYRKSQVILAEGVTLTNEGTLTIGGIQGWNGMNPTGQTVNQYAEITMSTGSQIVNSGTLNCYGYIKDAKDATGTLITHGNTSNLLTPLVIYDYRGGSYSTWAASGLLRSWKAMPFNVFDIPNIQSETLINSGCLWQVMVKLPLNNVTTTTAALLGTSSSTSLIRLNSGTVTYKYHAPKGYGYDDFQRSVTAETANITTFTVNGNVSISSMKMDIGVSIDTSEFMLPFSYKFHFLFNSGSSVVSNKVKFLGGSYVEVGKNATVSIQANTIAYQNYVPAIITGRTNAAYWPSYATSATIVNNGTLSIASGFGGIVQSTSEGATLQTVSGYSSSVTETEATSGEKGGLSGTSESRSETARFTLLDLKRVVDGSETVYEYGKVSSARFEETIGSSASYTSKHILDHADYGWLGSGTINNTLYRIRYSLGLSSASMPTGYVNQFPSYATETVLSKPVSGDDRYVFEGLYYDSACTASKKLSIDGNGNPVLDVAAALSLLNGSNYLTLYAKWIDTTLENYRLITSYQTSTNHVNLATVTNETPGTVSEGVALSSSISNVLLVNVTSTTEGTGTLTRYVFDGYTVVITDSSSTQKQTIRVQANGSDSNGYFSGFAMDGTTADALLANGDIVTATAEYVPETISYAFEISLPTTALSSRGGTAEASISVSSAAVSAFSEAGIPVTYAWSCANSKLSFNNSSSASPTMTNNYKYSTTTTSATVKCVITAGTFQLASLEGQVQLKKGRTE